MFTCKIRNVSCIGLPSTMPVWSLWCGSPGGKHPAGSKQSVQICCASNFAANEIPDEDVRGMQSSTYCPGHIKVSANL